MPKGANDNRRKRSRRDMTAMIFVVWVVVGFALILAGMALAFISVWFLLVSAIGSLMLYFADQ